MVCCGWAAWAGAYGLLALCYGLCESDGRLKRHANDSEIKTKAAPNDKWLQASVCNTAKRRAANATASATKTAIGRATRAAAAAGAGGLAAAVAALAIAAARK